MIVGTCKKCGSHGELHNTITNERIWNSYHKCMIRSPYLLCERCKVIYDSGKPCVPTDEEIAR